MEGDPHRVLEGLAIAGRAIGASHGYVYVRAEYPMAVGRLRRAVEQCHRLGLLGDGILGTNFSFDVTIKEGAGAFVCGEETALLASIEGRRGMPRPRPPFPAQEGLFGKPTVINVETLATVPSVVLPARVVPGHQRRGQRALDLRHHRAGRQHRTHRGAHGQDPP